MNNMSTRMDNQQLHLNNRQIQVIVSGRFGDGYLYPEGDRSYYMTDCKYKEYLQYKQVQYLPKTYSREKKRWSSETIQKWSKLQEELKSTDIDRRTLAAMLRKVSI